MSKDLVFAVFKEGVYRHECGGIFTTHVAARDAMNALAEGDRDDYHEYTVVPFALDERTPDAEGGYNHLVEAEPIYRAKKGATV